MPNRYDTQGPISGRGEPAGHGERLGDEGRAFGDRGFRAEDGRLSADMKRYNARFGGVRVEYGHDQNYRPGYHAGGSRFGFFGASHERSVDPDEEFDPDYLAWRDRQMQRHDLDYADWRRDQLRKYDDDYWRFRSERRDDFHQRFQDWRAQRDAEVAPAPDTPKTGDKD